MKGGGGGRFIRLGSKLQGANPRRVVLLVGRKSGPTASARRAASFVPLASKRDLHRMEQAHVESITHVRPLGCRSYANQSALGPEAGRPDEGAAGRGRWRPRDCNVDLEQLKLTLDFLPPALRFGRHFSGEQWAKALWLDERKRLGARLFLPLARCQLSSSIWRPKSSKFWPSWPLDRVFRLFTARREKFAARGAFLPHKPAGRRLI